LEGPSYVLSVGFRVGTADILEGPSYVLSLGFRVGTADIVEGPSYVLSVGFRVGTADIVEGPSYILSLGFRVRTVRDSAALAPKGWRSAGQWIEITLSVTACIQAGQGEAKLQCVN